jgi:SAM-dependent methyltransferase
MERGNAMNQSAISEDADNYYLRNADQHKPSSDPMLPCLQRIHRATPIRSVLEIGSNTGWRLDGIRKHFDKPNVVGVEASLFAVEESKATHPHIPAVHGVAPDVLFGFSDNHFDTVIVGFLIYLLPRNMLFHFAAEVDRILKDDGHIVIEDFLHPNAVSRDYTHNDQLRVFKHDPSAPWSWSPTYTLVDRQLIEHEAHVVDNADPSRWITIDALRKHPLSVAYPAT